MYILTVTLNPALDRTVSVDVFSAGKDLSTKVDWVIAGGKGVNVARVLSRLGNKVLAMGLLGGNTGRSILSFLEKEKIPASFIPTAAATRVHTTIRDISTGEITRLLERGALVSKKEYIAFRNEYTKRLKRARFVVLSGSLPQGLKPDTYCELIALARKAGVVCALDSSGEALKRGITTGPDIIKPNYDELTALLGEKKGFKITPEVFDRLRKYHCRYALLTMGAGGAWVSDFDQAVCFKTKQVRGKNHVGCGDAFLAGFISALIRNGDLKSCARVALACAKANLYAPYTGAVVLP